MHPINWVIVVGWIGYVVWDGLRRSRGTTDLHGYFQGGRTLPWWAVGLSVMATQLSAITMIGTTGQGATAGIESIWEGTFADGRWVPGRLLNGDESHQGRHLRIPEGKFGIQRVRLYRYH